MGLTAPLALSHTALPKVAGLGWTWHDHWRDREENPVDGRPAPRQKVSFTPTSPGGGGEGLAQGLGVTTFAFGGAWWPLTNAGEGGRHKASVLGCLPLAVPMGLSPLLILTLCGSERVLLVSTEPLDDLSCLTTPSRRRAVACAVGQVHPGAHSESMLGLPTPALTCAPWGVHLHTPGRGGVLKMVMQCSFGPVYPVFWRLPKSSKWRFKRMALMIGNPSPALLQTSTVWPL